MSKHLLVTSVAFVVKGDAPDRTSTPTPTTSYCDIYPDDPYCWIRID